MKKILLSFLALTMSCTSFGQIAYDKPGQNGDRYLKTTEVFIRRGFDDTMPAYYALCAIQSDDDVSWALSVRLNGDVPECLSTGALLMIRTVTGEVLESKNVMGEHDTYDLLHKNVYGLYPLEEESVEALLAGIVKIRIEAPTELIDIEYDEKRVKKISKELTNRYEKMKEEISKKKNIRDNF